MFNKNKKCLIKIEIKMFNKKIENKKCLIKIEIKMFNKNRN
jgi:hypothetical protein